MSRNPRLGWSHGCVTPNIIQGTYPYRKLGRTTTFDQNCQKLAGAFRGARFRARKKPIATLFEVVETESRILHDLAPKKAHVVPLLLQLATRFEDWVRAPGDWMPTSADAQRQLTELVHHLFALYPTPRFFESTWRPSRRAYRDWRAFDWFIHVGRGGSLRTAPRLPSKLTRAAARDALLAPGKSQPIEALRWGQLVSLGATPAFAQAFLQTRFALDFERDELWLPVAAKLVKEAELELREIGPILDFVNYEVRRRPAFSLKGRTVRSLRRGMVAWHAELAQFEMLKWYGVHPDDAWVPYPDAKAWSDDDWQVTELCTVRALHEEGRRMRHCVLSYCHKCMSGGTSIWSVVPRGTADAGRSATLRIDTWHRRIVEARSVANGPLAPDCHRFVRRWAEQFNLRWADR